MIFVSMSDGRCIELTEEQKTQIENATRSLGSSKLIILRTINTDLNPEHIVGIYSEKTRFIEYNGTKIAIAGTEPDRIEDEPDDNCPHALAEVRFKMDKNGKKYYIKYCPVCKTVLSGRANKDEINEYAELVGEIPPLEI